MIDNVSIERVYENKLRPQNLLETSYTVCASKAVKEHCNTRQTRHVLDHKALYTLSCSLVLLYLSDCAEVWGNTYNKDPTAIMHTTKKSHKDNK